jgi:hypothetical protein
VPQPWAALVQQAALTLAAVWAAGVAAGVRSTSVQDVMRRLLQRKNIMVRPPGPSAAIKEAKYIAAVDILQVRIHAIQTFEVVADAHLHTRIRPGQGPATSLMTWHLPHRRACEWPYRVSRAAVLQSEARRFVIPTIASRAASSGTSIPCAGAG